MSDSSQADNLARQACATCRRQKRRCSRDLPSCHLCVKNRRPCEYPSEVEALGDVSTTAASSELQLPARNSLVNLFFLDSYMFERRKASVSNRQVRLPKEFLDLIDDNPDLHDDLNLFFASIHPFFPIVSKLRLYHQELVSVATRPLRPDTQLLLIVTRLVCTNLEDGDESAALYWKAKRCFAFLETSGIVSIRMLQAALLLAHHEISNALYPSAFTTVAVCARLGHAMGIHDVRGSPQLLPSTHSLTEHEEARRTWWAVIVLDRYVNIGLSGRPLICADAKPDDLLPMDEGSWESGEPSIRPSLAVSAEVAVSACPFARTCQAAHLLSRVLQHTNERPADYARYYQEGLLLARVVTAFGWAMAHEVGKVVESQSAPLLPGLGLAYSAQLALFDTHSCAEADHPGGTGLPSQLEMQVAAIQGLKTVCLAVADLARRVSRLLSAGGDIRAVSPLLSDCLYQAAKYHSWYFRENGRQGVLDRLVTIKGALGAMGQTWPLASGFQPLILSVILAEWFRMCGTACERYVSEQETDSFLDEYLEILDGHDLRPSE